MTTKIDIIKTQDQTVFGTTLVDDNELAFHAEANTTWGLHFDVYNSADDVAGTNAVVQMAIMAPSGSVVTARSMICVDDGTNGIIDGANVQGPLPPSNQGTPGSPWDWGAPGSTINPAFSWVRTTAQVVIGAVPGQVTLQFAEKFGTSSIGTTIYAGSSLRAQRSV